MRRPVLLSLVILLSSATAYANSDCDQVLLQRNVSLLNEQVYHQLSWMQLVDRDNYEDAKKSAAALIPGYFDGSYDEFASRRARLRTESKLDVVTDTARSLMQSLLADDAVAAWEQCMSHRGLYSRLEKVTPSEVLLTIYFDPTPGLNKVSKIKVDLPASVAAPDLRALRTMGIGSKSFVLRRTENKEFLGAMSGIAGAGGQYSTTFYIPWAYELGPDESLSDSPAEVASQSGTCEATTRYATGNARREIVLEAYVYAKSWTEGTIGANIFSNGAETCGNSAKQSINMSLTVRCERQVLEPNKLYTFTAKQMNLNAHCNDSITTIRVLR